MKKYDVHICMVSGQPTPNYIPILDNSFRPEEVILLISDEMKNQAEMLQDVLKERCPNVRVHTLAVEDVYNVAAIREPLVDKIAEIGKENIALNVTGGTKLMALEAYQLISNDLEYDSFYFIPEENSVFILGSHEKIPLEPPKLLVKDYLKLHGYIIKNATEPKNSSLQNLSELTQELIMMTDNRKNALSHLNGLISAHNKALKINIVGREPHHAAFQDMLGLFADYNLLKAVDDHIVFSSHEARDYINGGWFEEHVFEMANKLDQMQDCLMNVEIDHAWKHEKQKNEIDVIYMRNNTLHMIECKTVNYDSTSHRGATEQGMNALYKLEALKKIGGSQCKARFASYRRLTSAMRDRAKASNISISEDKELTGLRTQLFNWDK